MNTLYVAWQDSQTRSWHTVGQLTQEKNGVYSFVYTKGAEASPRFGHFGRMRDFSKKYYSFELFPLFTSRILNSSRPEYPDYLKWLALDPEQKTEPMQLLARSGGQRATDQLHIFPFPSANEQGQRELFFLAHGLRYLDQKSSERLARLHPGERLDLLHEPSNEHDGHALLLMTTDHVKVGYCPRYLNRDLGKLLDDAKTGLTLTVERTNPDAPLQFRLLCKLVFWLPPGTLLFADDEYQPLANGDPVAV